MRGKPVVALVVVVAGSVIFAGCSSASKTVTSTTTASPATSSAEGGAGALTIKNFSFSPTPLTAKAGETITITNRDTTDHTVTDNGGAFATGHIAPATSKTITLTKAGTFHYHCSIHPFMNGEIDVSS
jgi:plastocyanin